MADVATAVKRALGELEERAARMESRETAEAGARPLAMGVAATYACARLCAQGAWAAARGDRRTAAVASRLAARGLVPPEAPADLGLAFGE